MQHVVQDSSAGRARPLEEELQQAANTPLPDDEDDQPENAAAQQVCKHASVCSAPAMHGFLCIPVPAVKVCFCVWMCQIRAAEHGGREFCKGLCEDRLICNLHRATTTFSPRFL